MDIKKKKNGIYKTKKIMSGPLSAANISEDSIHLVLSRYEQHVPEKLRALDEVRYRDIPESLAKRKAIAAYLSKGEVERLVEWKL